MNRLNDSSPHLPGHRIRRVSELRQSCLFSETWCELMKWCAGQPLSRFRRINVSEDPQDPCAPRRPGWKSIHVQQVIALFERQVAAVFFQWTKARKVQRNTSRVRRKQVFDEPSDLVGIIPHDALQLLVRAIVLPMPLHPAYLI